ncbi:hypothetical protein [Streptomyces chartreusis]|uniref:hypothetical protein n=1 Tax=Streptomyces chartreusis TaxID=1969 RepID=UPI0016732AF8|nr:hypothetical protein [Streptomyces chartreusis]GGX56000.1 hypothetical protein GCM10010321_86570 [Streptomyces chartreusis]
MSDTTDAPRRELSADEVTVTTDKGRRPVVLLPDDIIAALNTASRTDVKDYGIEGSESRHYGADTWEARTVQTIYAAVTASPDVEDSDKRGIKCGYFYGAVIAERHWNHDTRWWADYRRQQGEWPLGGLITQLRYPGHPEHMTVYFGDC